MPMSRGRGEGRAGKAGGAGAAGGAGTVGGTGPALIDVAVAASSESRRVGIIVV
jgi:hypothetical protein